jgi:ABC-type Fe3+ transport system substrate-binding protein
MTRLGTWLLGMLALIAAAPSAANAQSAPAEWQQVLDKAKTQTLVMINQGNPAFDAAIDAFTKKYGIKVEATVSRPSMAITRLQTEQKNGRYLADMWWAITGLMTSVAAPAGMFAKFEDYLILPEVKDRSNWRHADYIYGDAGNFVFTYSHEVNRSVYRNRDVLPQVKVDTAESLMQPQLKGKIAMRDASYPNAGSYALAPIYKAKGADFLLKFLKQQEPRVFENPEQLDNALIRGASVVAIGGQGSSISQCKSDGGCKNIDTVEGIASASSRGIGIMKNPPNPEATKIFVNWILSKEGQELLIREWAKSNQTGATSMRKDVPPAPNHEEFLPDFSDPGKYVWVATQKGDEEINVVTKIFKDWAGK